jgi:hypothetical protein
MERGHDDDIYEFERSVEATFSLEQDFVRYCAPVFDGLKPAAAFSYPYTTKSLDEIEVEVPQVLLIHEFTDALDDLKHRLRPAGIHVRVLAWRDYSALLFVYRPELVQKALCNRMTTNNLYALGYPSNEVEEGLDELVRRIRAFDATQRQVDFWDYPHEIGYFLGYPPIDVVAFVRNRGLDARLEGPWRVYGCDAHVASVHSYFDMYRMCVFSYWREFMSGARLEDLALMGDVMRKTRYPHSVD